jgi:hypothetical protein
MRHISVNYRNLYLLEKIDAINTKIKQKQVVDPPLPQSSSSHTPTILDILQMANENLDQYRQLNIDIDTDLPANSLLIVKVLVFTLHSYSFIKIFIITTTV